MSFTQNLVLWLHLAFVAFTIGPVTLAIMSTPRYIRQRDVRIVRYLNRITVIFAFGSLGVLIAGMALASMKSWAGKPWVIVSATLFVVALFLLGLIVRDQRKAIKAIDEAAAVGPPGPLGPPGASATDLELTEAAEPSDSRTVASADEPAAAATSQGTIAVQVANVERGRIAMAGGVVSLIWLVILVLMVWH
jgi:hypothetical protein